MRGILNFIFGQISGEVTGQELYHEKDQNDYEVPADMKLTDFNNLTNFGIEDPRMTTIGGVAFRHLDRLPQPGDTVTVEGMMITILEMDEHRITRVRVSQGPSEDESSSDKESAQDTCIDSESRQKIDQDTNTKYDSDEQIKAANKKNGFK